MSADEVAGSAETGKSYKIKVSVINPSDEEKFALTSNQPSDLVEINGGGAEVIKLTAKDVAKSGSAKVKLELKTGTTGDNNSADAVQSSEDKTVDMYAVLLKDMSNFAIEDPGLRPASNLLPVVDDSNKGFKPGVIGYYAGEKISLVATDFTVYGDTTNPGYAPVPEIDPALKKTVVEKTRVRVIINDNKGTEVEREFSYSNEARKVNKVEMGNSTITVTDGNDKAWADIQASFTIKDQYGAVIAKDPYITYSDFDKDKVEITGNGTTAAKIKVKTTNTEATLTVKFKFPNSSYVFEKVVTFNRTT